MQFSIINKYCISNKFVEAVEVFNQVDNEELIRKLNAESKVLEDFTFKDRVTAMTKINEITNMLSNEFSFSMLNLNEVITSINPNSEEGMKALCRVEETMQNLAKNHQLDIKSIKQAVEVHDVRLELHDKKFTDIESKLNEFKALNESTDAHVQNVIANLAKHDLNLVLLNKEMDLIKIDKEATKVNI